MGHDSPHSGSRGAAGLDSQALMDFAELALREAPVKLDADMIDAATDVAEWLMRACLPGSPSRMMDVQRTLSRFDIGPAHAVDICLPATARRLGEFWLSDDLPFAEVSSATARLMQLARLLESNPSHLRPPRPRGLDLLVITPPLEQHLLGAQILTGQLRRRGHQVRFVPGATAFDLDYLLQGTRFDAVLVSVGSWATLRDANTLVTPLLSSDMPRVILGGAVVAEVPDLKSQSPVRWITNDISAALDGLTPQPAQAFEDMVLQT